MFVFLAFSAFVAVSDAQFTSVALFSQPGCTGNVVYGSATPGVSSCVSGCSGTTATVCTFSGGISPSASLSQGLFVTYYVSSTCTGTPIAGNFYATGGTNGCQSNGQISWKATCTGISVFNSNTICAGAASFSGPSNGCIPDPTGQTSGYISVQTISCSAVSSSSSPSPTPAPSSASSGGSQNYVVAYGLISMYSNAQCTGSPVVAAVAYPGCVQDSYQSSVGIVCTSGASTASINSYSGTSCMGAPTSSTQLQLSPSCYNSQTIVCVTGAVPATPSTGFVGISYVSTTACSGPVWGGLTVSTGVPFAIGGANSDTYTCSTSGVLTKSVGGTGSPSVVAGGSVCIDYQGSNSQITKAQITCTASGAPPPSSSSSSITASPSPSTSPPPSAGSPLLPAYVVTQSYSSSTCTGLAQSTTYSYSGCADLGSGQYKGITCASQSSGSVAYYSSPSCGSATVVNSPSTLGSFSTSCNGGFVKSCMSGTPPPAPVGLLATSYFSSSACAGGVDSRTSLAADAPFVSPLSSNLWYSCSATGNLFVTSGSLGSVSAVTSNSICLVGNGGSSSPRNSVAISCVAPPSSTSSSSNAMSFSFTFETTVGIAAGVGAVVAVCIGMFLFMTVRRKSPKPSPPTVISPTVVTPGITVRAVTGRGPQS